MLKRLFFLAAIGLSTLQMAHAHHPAASSSTGSSFSATGWNAAGQINLNKKSTVYFNYQLIGLDNSIGEQQMWTLGALVNINKSIQLNVEGAMSHLNHNFRSNEFGLNDLFLGANFKLLQDPIGLNLIQRFSLPVGSTQKGFGRGSIGNQSILLLSKSWNNWNTWLSTGIQFGFETAWEPIYSSQIGFQSPSFFHEKISFTLSVSHQMFFKSSIFQNGSSKVFLEPGIQFSKIWKEFFMKISGAVSIYDSLQRKTNVTLTTIHNALLSDILYSGQITLGYSF